MKFKEPILLCGEQTVLAHSFREYPRKQKILADKLKKKGSTNANVYPSTTSQPVPITGGACVISSALIHNYSPVISKA